MKFFVYIIANSQDNDFYKGFTSDLKRRLDEHNEGKSNFTSTKSKWDYIGIYEFDTKTQALSFERKIKKYNRRSLELLIISELNVVQKYRAG